jgi:hypothetical protein
MSVASIQLVKGFQYKNKDTRLARKTIVAAAMNDIKTTYPAMNPPRYLVYKSEDVKQNGKGKLMLTCPRKGIVGCKWHLNAYTSADAPTTWRFFSLCMLHSCHNQPTNPQTEPNETLAAPIPAGYVVFMPFMAAATIVFLAKRVSLFLYWNPLTS